MTTTEALRARRGLRRYRLGADTPPEYMEMLLEAAMPAPSA